MANRRLWIVEKPLWAFARRSATLWRGAVSIWGAVLRLLSGEAPSLAILATYGIGGAIALSVWAPARAWLGVSRAVDVALLAVCLLWLLMLVVWAHEAALEHLLRWLPALLAIPLWLPFILVMFALGAGATAAMFAVSVVLTPLGFLAMFAGLAYAGWRKRHGITLRCTHGSCKSSQKLFRDLEVRYLCPGRCGAKYGYVIPSHLGLLTHRCTCGAQLPALAAMRRLRHGGRSIEETLSKECPEGHPWGAGTDPLPTGFLAVVGGGRVGKTCYLTTAVQALRDSSRAAGFHADFELDSDRMAHDTRLRRLREGGSMASTTRGAPEAIVLRLHQADQAAGAPARGTPVRRDARRGERRLHLYDAAGEEYSAVERPRDQEFVFFHDLTGILFLIDPLGFPEVEAAARAELGAAWAGYEPSAHRLDDVVASMKRNVSRFLRRSGGHRGSIPMAVVISKADAPVVRDRVGLPGLRAAKSRLGWTSVKSDAEVEHDLCRQALLDWGAAHALSVLENDFRPLRYFSCSALGRAADGTGRPLAPDRVLPPLLWLLEQEVGP